MSGAAANWHRMAFAILENGLRHQNSDVKLWSDMRALQDVMTNGGGTAIEVSNSVLQGYNIIAWLKTQRERFDTVTCEQGNGKTSVHFSHSITDHLTEVQQRGVEYRHEMRPKMAKEWLARWADSCIDGNSNFKRFLLAQRTTEDIALAMKEKEQ